jgi:hypothetical protein
MNTFKNWWLQRQNIAHVRFSLALSHFWLNLEMLDYGMTINLDLPYVLDKLNPLNWITKVLFRTALKDPDGFAISKTKNISEHKSLEVEIATVCEILAFEYHWTAHTDHWGHQIRTALTGIELSAKLYDHRHWDYDEETR